LPWAECEARLPAYCAARGISKRGQDFSAALKAELTTLAAAVDAGFPANSELSVDPDGTPHLKQLATTERPAGLVEFEQEIRARMPERHLLGILKYAEHWSRYTRHFGPPSGSDPKLAQAVQRYLFTVFGYGCNLGPGPARAAIEAAIRSGTTSLRALGRANGVSHYSIMDHRDNHRQLAPARHLHPPKWLTPDLAAKAGARCSGCGGVLWWWHPQEGVGGCAKCWPAQFDNGRKSYYET
jgi:hypothetical protein